MDEHLKIATFLTNLMDEQFRLGTFKFGLDPLLDFIPGFGDVFTTLLSFYLVWIGVKMHLPKQEISRMVRNVIIDFVIGAVPILGNVGDFFYKANKANLQILRKYADTPSADVARL